MKSIYMLCALLSATMSLFVLANGAPQSSTGIETSTILQNIIKLPKNANIKDSNTTTALPNTNTTTTPTTTPTTTVSTTSTSNITTSTTTKPTSTTTTTTVTSTTPEPTTKSTEKTSTSVPTTTPPATSTNASTLITTTAQSQTTAIPSLPSKDRHFDGLSFFGGIILAACLTAIAVFSWKFYRQCNEGNYRTL